MNLARASIPEAQVVQLLNGLHNSAGNNLGANLNEISMQSRLFNLLNPPQGGLVARDNNAALSEALIGPLGTPLHPSFAFAPIKIEAPAGSSTAATTNLANVAPGTLTGKDVPIAPSAANTQAIVQAFQGILQPGQGAVKGTEEPGKTIVKGGGPGLPDVLTTNQGTGKKGAESLIEGTSKTLMPLPTTLTGKGGKGIEGGDDAKLPIGQATNSAQNTLVVTATSGSQATGQTATTGQQPTGISPNTITTNTGTASQDPNSTDIKSLVASALPPLEIYDPKQELKDGKEVTGRPEVNIDNIDEDENDEDDFHDMPIVDGKRASSATGAPIKAPKSKIGLSIIENIMVFLHDLKNKQLDDKTEQQMLLDLFVDIFSKKKRKSCRVNPGDTLEDIAKQVLQESRLTPLLYAINVHEKHIKPIENEENKQAIYAIQPDKQTILLPHRSEILRYKVHVLGDKTALTLYARSLIVAEEFTTYTCREGDTLKSIAKSHIDLQDESKWAEVARLNGLSVRLGKKGKMIAVLKPGQVLKIPKTPVMEEDDEEFESIIEPSMINVCTNLDEITQEEASINEALATMEQRVISQSDLTADTVLIKLELKKGDSRINVIEWDINPISSTLKLFDKTGFCKVIPIALPTQAARELAENDLKVNANRYCELFLSGKLAA